MSSITIESMQIVIPFIPIMKDIETMIEIARSTPIIETAKGKNSDYKKTI